MNAETRTWRTFLGEIISDSQERTRIANELGVSPITLIRWGNGVSNPRPNALRRLLDILPQHREILASLIQEEFSDAITSDGDRETLLTPNQEIPSEFYSQVFNIVTGLNETLRFWSISNLILQQAHEQLDPNRLGMAITVVRCMPPSKEGKIRSLRESVGRGSPPWMNNLEQRAVFLGAESLAGYVVTTSHSETMQNTQNAPNKMLPSYHSDFEMSATASPIIHTNRVAGCLLVSSTVPDYFLPFRQKLIQDFANLMILAFSQEEFYPLELIDLRIMPSVEEQEKSFSNFQQRVLSLMVESIRANQPLNLMQAEEVALQQLEEELLNLSLNADR